MNIRKPFLLIVAASTTISAAASAQSTYKFDDIINPGSCSFTGAGSTVSGATGIGNTFSCASQTSNTNTLNINAYSYNGANFQNAAVKNNGSGYGLGVGNIAEGGTSVSASPNHAMDNTGGGFDLLVFDFGSSTSLNSVTIGWSYTDADFQVLRWVGAGGPGLNGQTMAQALGGWQLVNALNGPNGVGSPDVEVAVNGSNLSSRYWMVSAYNSGFGNGGNTHVDSGDDALKLIGVKSTNVVPEPASFALLAPALAGLLYWRRRRTVS